MEVNCDLILWSFNYKLKLAQNFDFFMLPCNCLNSFANCKPWGFSISLVILRSASRFLPRICNVLFPQKWIFTDNFFEPWVCGVPRLFPFISHYSCHSTLLMFLSYGCRWFIICIHNLKFMEMSCLLVLFWCLQWVSHFPS